MVSRENGVQCRFIVRSGGISRREGRLSEDGGSEAGADALGILVRLVENSINRTNSNFVSRKKEKKVKWSSSREFRQFVV